MFGGNGTSAHVHVAGAGIGYNEACFMNNLFLFTGSETYLLREKVRAWKEAFRGKHGDINLAMLDGEKAPLGEIMAAIEAAPFLGEKRLIFIENLPVTAKNTSSEKEATIDEEDAKDDLKKFAEKLKDIPETSVVVFIQPNPDKRKAFYKALVKLAKGEEFKPLEGPRLNGWAQAEAKKHGSSIDAVTADYLISLTGQDLWRISQEIQKLANFRPEQPIARADIDHLVVPTVEANIFHFTDALSAKDHRRAIRNLHRSMASGENLKQLFYMIVRQFRLLLQIKSYKNQYPGTTPLALATHLKLHPFVAKNILAQIGHFGPEELKSAYSRLLEIDVDLKTSHIRVTTDDQDELALAIEQFILKFCA